MAVFSFDVINRHTLPPSNEDPTAYNRETQRFSSQDILNILSVSLKENPAHWFILLYPDDMAGWHNTSWIESETSSIDTLHQQQEAAVTFCRALHNSHVNSVPRVMAYTVSDVNTRDDAEAAARQAYVQDTQ